MGYLLRSYRFAGGGIVLPVGLILPYNGTLSSAPSGTEIWNYASGDRLIRAYSSAGGTGGSASGTYTSGAGGTHTGSTANMWACYNTGAGYNRFYKTQANHSHTVTITYRPQRRQQPFVRVTTELTDIPNLCGFLTDQSSLAGLTAFGTNGYYLGAPNSRTAASNQGVSKSVSLNSVGNHHHEESYIRLDSNNGQLVPNPQTTRGSAGHGDGGATFTNAFKNYCVGMWYANGSGLKVPAGAFGLFDGATIPDGWLLCDGTSGTPNLSDTFLKIDTTNLGVQSGNDTLTVSGYSTYAGSHNHTGSNAYDSASARHTSSSGNHRHTINTTGKAFTYPYYRLRVIKADL